MSKQFRIGISSPPDREKLVAEILFGEGEGVLLESPVDLSKLETIWEQVAEINQESDGLQVELYARRSGEPWTFSYAAFLDALKQAKQRLVGIE